MRQNFPEAFDIYMETEGGRKKYAKKIFSPPREAPKRKKNQRKDSESKLPTQGNDDAELKTIEEDMSNQNNAVHYVIKLKYQLQATKQKLKNEEEKFKHLIKSISAHFGSQDENFSEMLRSAHIFGADTSEEIKADSGFEKLFTTHKYLISDNTNEKINDHHLDTAQKPRGRKNKDQASVSKSNHTETQAENHATNNQEKSNTKTKKKRSMSIHEDGEEPKKEKKRKKNKNEKENNEAKEPEVTVIPSLSQENHETQEDHVDKIKQAEEAINQYQEFAHRPQGFDPLANKMLEDSMKYLAQQNPEQAHLLNQQMFGDMGNVLGFNSMMPGMEMLDQNKVMEELMKMGIQGPMLRAMVQTPDMSNYYQMNNQK